MQLKNHKILEVRKKSFCLEGGITTDAIIYYFYLDDYSWCSIIVCDGFLTIEKVEEPKLKYDIKDNEFNYLITECNCYNEIKGRILGVYGYFFNGLRDECSGVYFYFDTGESISIIENDDSLRLLYGKYERFQKPHDLIEM
ncbi:hypothetical protein JBO49_26500 [Serratia fonticola]|uniref:hypothetical protein n=1 Tax=Serratia fonticola TaxID=47917 RepID=UPI00192B24F3|nr:hypothetical protein [Serratia fonticola]MBL5864159.1 hypothetical protein [Serratia fonticola]